MTLYSRSQRISSSTDRSFNPDRRHRADFARQAVAEAFGRRGAEVLDQGNFIDRQPGKFLMLPLVVRAR